MSGFYNVIIRFFCTFLMLLSYVTQAQNLILAQSTAFTVSFGPSMFHGDVCPDCANLGYDMSVGARFHIQQKMYFNSRFHLGYLGANDSKSTKRADKALSFSSNTYQLEVNMQYFFTQYGDYTNKNKVHPYGLGGVGMLFFNPQTKLNNRRVNLQALQTEGVAYAKTTLTVNVGLGLLFDVNDKLFLTAEYRFYYTFSDYIDDVSGDYAERSLLFGDGLTLADRSSEKGYEPSTSNNGEYWQAGSQRGSNQRNDFYTILSLGVGFNLVK